LTISGLTKKNHDLFLEKKFFFALNSDYLDRTCTMYDEDSDLRIYAQQDDQVVILSKKENRAFLQEDAIVEEPEEDEIEDEEDGQEEVEESESE
jgi:hypothetical protein